MLEICPPALCACGSGAPPRWHSHAWLCSFQRAVAEMCYRIASPVSAPPNAAASATCRAHIATSLELHSCTKRADNHIRITSLRKNVEGHPLGRHYVALLPFFH